MKNNIVRQMRNKKHLCHRRGAKLIEQETRVNTGDDRASAAASAESVFNKLDTETRNSTTGTQKRDTTDAEKGKRRAVVRRETNMVNCL